MLCSTPLNRIILNMERKELHDYLSKKKKNVENTSRLNNKWVLHEGIAHKTNTNKKKLKLFRELQGFTLKLDSI